MSVTSLILVNYVVMIMLNCICKRKSKICQTKKILLNIGLLVLRPKDLLIVLHHLALFIFIVILLKSLNWSPAVGASFNMCEDRQEDK